MSLSPVTIRTSYPRASARFAAVPMRSSASNPSRSRTGIPSASVISLIHGNCAFISCGAFSRVALYSGYISLRNVSRLTSKATTTLSGASLLRMSRSART
jgi:hypothetical protein